LAPGHHGYQRACDLISGQASNGPNGSPVLACAGKTDPPSRLILSQRSLGFTSPRAHLEAQADQAFRNLGVALAAAGCTTRDLVKLNVFVRDMAALLLYRKARDRFLGAKNPPTAPAITVVEVSKLFRDDLLIEIEAVAAG
jgi:enamine deaminase RidA (YjgF/YER057c/UK114 family)